MPIFDHIKRLVKNADLRTPVDQLLMVAGLGVIIIVAVWFLQHMLGN